MTLPRPSRSVIWALATLAVGEAVLQRDLTVVGGDGLGWLARVVAAGLVVAVAGALAWPVDGPDRPGRLAGELSLGLVTGVLLVLPLLHGHRSDVLRGTWALVGLGLGLVFGVLRRVAARPVGGIAVGSAGFLGLVVGHAGSAHLAFVLGEQVLGRNHEGLIALSVAALVALRLVSRWISPGVREVAVAASRPGPLLERALLQVPVASALGLGLLRQGGRVAASVTLAASGLVMSLAAITRGDSGAVGPAVAAMLVIGGVVGAPVGTFVAPRGLLTVVPIARGHAARVAGLIGLGVVAVALVLGWLLAPVPWGLAPGVLAVGWVGVAAALGGLAVLVGLVGAAGPSVRSAAVPVVAALSGALFVTAPAVQANVGAAHGGLVLENVVAASAFAVVVGLAAVSFVSWWRGVTPA